MDHAEHMSPLQPPALIWATMSGQTSPTQPNHPQQPPPTYAHTHTTPITPITATAHPAHILHTAHTTPSSSLGLSTATSGFPDVHLFSHIDIKDEVEGLPLPELPPQSQSAQSGGSSGEVTPPPPTSKGKNGATGPAEGKAKPHLCHICGRGFTTGGHLQRHQRIHTGVKAFRCPYPGCDTKTSRQDNLQQHYRTHLSPELRRGDGSQARAAVNAAMEAAGMKSVSTRQPRKSKASNAGTPSSASATGSTSHLPSPYQTPTSQGPSPYAPYMFDPTQHGYPAYPLPPPIQMLQPHPQQSVNSSRAPSPTSAHHPQAAGPGPGTINPNQHPHQHQFYPQPFPPYGYPTAMPPQAYRHFAGMTNPYAPPHPHHPMYSPGGRPVEEAGPPPQFYGHHLYSPMQPNFGHSREGSYGGMMTPGYAQGPMANGNGYPPRTQTNTPMSQNHGHGQGHEDGKNGDLSLSAYARGHRPMTPSSASVGVGHSNGHDDGIGNGDHGPGMGVHRSGGSRRTPPMSSQGVDPSSMNRSIPPGIIHHPSYGYQQPHPSQHHHMGGYGYGTPQSVHSLAGRNHASALSQRASISSLSDGSGGGEESQKGQLYA